MPRPNAIAASSAPTHDAAQQRPRLQIADVGERKGLEDLRLGRDAPEDLLQRRRREIAIAAAPHEDRGRLRVAARDRQIDVAAIVSRHEQCRRHVANRPDDGDGRVAGEIAELAVLRALDADRLADRILARPERQSPWPR